MRITEKHLKQLGFTYHEYDPRGGQPTANDSWVRWFDAWVNSFGVVLYCNPFLKGWLIESAKPVRQVYSVKALKRYLIKAERRAILR